MFDTDDVSLAPTNTIYETVYLHRMSSSQWLICHKTHALWSSKSDWRQTVSVILKQPLFCCCCCCRSAISLYSWQISCVLMRRLIAGEAAQVCTCEVGGATKHTQVTHGSTGGLLGGTTTNNKQTDSPNMENKRKTGSILLFNSDLIWQPFWSSHSRWH